MGQRLLSFQLVLNILNTSIEVFERRLQRITTHMSSSCSPQTTDHQTTSTKISCKLQHLARTRHHAAFPKYKKVQTLLTLHCRQELITYNNVDSVQIVFHCVRGHFLIAVQLWLKDICQGKSYSLNQMENYDCAVVHQRHQSRTY